MLIVLLVLVTNCHAWEFEADRSDVEDLPLFQIKQLDCLIEEHHLEEGEEIYNFPDKDSYFIRDGKKVRFILDYACLPETYK